MSAPDFTRSLEDMLPRMRMPCLVYAGDADASHSKAKKCVESMSNATFVSLPGLNHGETERADIMLPHITKFLQKVRTALEATDL